MSEDFEILYSDSKESGSHHSHHHSDGEHHSSHHHSDESHHSSHHHGSHRHSKQRKRRKRILIITLSIVACLLIAIGVNCGVIHQSGDANCDVLHQNGDVNDVNQIL